MQDPYIESGAEDESEDYGEEMPCHHTFNEDEDGMFSDRDDDYTEEEIRGFHHKLQEFEHLHLHR